MEYVVTGEPCAVLYRVSTLGQDLDNQIPDVEKYVTGKGYVLARPPIKIKKSGASGIHAGDLAGVLDEMRQGLFKVVVVAHSSRLDRRDEAEQVRFELALYDAGGRVESARENGIILPSFRRGQGARHVAVAAQSGNAEYSRTAKEHTGAGVRRSYEAKAFVGRAPWGMEATGPKHGKRLTATPLVSEFGPQIYTRIAAAESLGDVCRWLTSQSVPTGPATRLKIAPWWPKTLSQLIRNTAYKGVSDVHYEVTWYTYDDSGNRVDHHEMLTWTHYGDAPVGAALWKRANDVLTGRRDDKRGPVSPRVSALEPLSGASFCMRCADDRGEQSPMYRIVTRDDAYLRCAGRGPDRKGCGFMVTMAEARRVADEVIGSLTEPEYEFVLIPGNGDEIDAALDRITRERQLVASRGLSWDEEDAARAKLRADYDHWVSVTRTPDRKIATAVLDPDDQPDTWGKRWQRMTDPERRRWLKSGRVTAYVGRVQGQVTMELEYDQDDD